MHSIFTRARTTSSKNLPKAPSSDAGGAGGTDEFGRVRSRGGGGAAHQHQHPPPTPSKDRQYNTMTGGRRDRDRDRDRDRSRGDTSFDSALLDPNAAAYGLQDGFLPTGLASTEPPDPERDAGQPYGYLSHGVNVVLGVEDATKLVEVLADELGRRGELSIFFSFFAVSLASWDCRSTPTWSFVNCFILSEAMPYSVSSLTVLVYSKISMALHIRPLGDDR